jgi:glycogen debranching enzyme
MVRGDDVFAFRFAIHKGDQKADGYDTFYLVERVGPITAGGKYSEVAFNTALPFGKKGDTPIGEKNAGSDKLFSIRYARTDNGIIGSLAVPPGIKIKIIFYHPWKRDSQYQFNDDMVITAGNHSFFFKAHHMTQQGIKENQLSCTFTTGIRDIPFYAGFDPPNADTLAAIPAQLTQLRKKELSAQPYVEGEWQGLLQSISHNLLWMRLYQPDHKRLYLPAGRRWIFPGPDGERDRWTLFEWDAFFNALQAVFFDPALARSEIRAVMACQYPWGNIPNWRSANSGSPDRSQPPVGTLAVMKCYLWTQDKSILSHAYDGLKQWHRFWKDPGINGTPRRDGNRDGLLEWGSDRDRVAKNVPPWEVKATGRQRAAWESGQDDLPNFDNIPFAEAEGTLKMNCLDLNALYTLDAQLLAHMAKILNKRKDFITFHREYKKMKRLINRQMWKGDFYYDRLWDGTYSTHKASSNFYPLLAGIPNPEQARKMARTLKQRQVFWGDYIIPTISRDNPAYKDQQYWRGTIWPPNN